MRCIGFMGRIQPTEDPLITGIRIFHVVIASLSPHGVEFIMEEHFVAYPGNADGLGDRNDGHGYVIVNWLFLGDRTGSEIGN